MGDGPVKTVSHHGHIKQQGHAPMNLGKKFQAITFKKAYGYVLSGNYLHKCNPLGHRIKRAEALVNEINS
jgi:hypothetical protein